ncbi:hypothetical protein GCM10008967_08280 [Bacillus carboniphilus]|uniref:N-acetyltransferase domain-containing protein n=1 Tax=Bacillus carboniphilus TaxID=86663 RepID=A0ABN0VY10_9BACI
MVYQSRFARKEDVASLKRFLEHAGVSSEGVDRLYEYFIILEKENKECVACLGVEPLKQVGLMRSLVMMPSVREEGLFLLFEKMMQLAQEKQVKQLLLATNRNSSVPFLAALGFNAVDREEVPEELSLSEHGKQLLQSEIVMFMQRIV